MWEVDFKGKFTVGAHFHVVDGALGFSDGREDAEGLVFWWLGFAQFGGAYYGWVSLAQGVSLLFLIILIIFLDIVLPIPSACELLL